MFDKHITLVLIPQETSEVKKLRLPLNFFILGVVLVVGFVIGWSFFVYDYLTIRTNIGQLEQNKKVHFLQKNKLKAFAQGQEDSDIHLNHLDELYFKLRSLTSLKSQRTLSQQELDDRVKQVASAQTEGVLHIISSDLAAAEQDTKEHNEKVTSLLNFFAKPTNPMNHFPRIWPVKGLLTTEFGMHFDRLTGQTKPHNGIVFATTSFSPVKATADGIVEYAGADEAYENLVVLDHGNGIKTRYGNISIPQIEVGDIVYQGYIIAEVANTGRTTGPQLYYEIRLNDIPQNPIKYIPSQTEVR